jgi:hypothetical protein
MRHLNSERLEWTSSSEHQSIRSNAILINVSLRSLPPLIIALFPGQQRSLDKLKADRINLANQVASLINDFGPKLYDDFDEVRCLVLGPILCLLFTFFRCRHVFCLRLVLLHLTDLRVYGEGKAVSAPLTPKVWDLFTQ